MNDPGIYIAIWLISAAIGLFILFAIIRNAAKSANAETERLLRMLVKLKMEELRRQGVTDPEIHNTIYSVKDI